MNSCGKNDKKKVKRKIHINRTWKNNSRKKLHYKAEIKKNNNGKHCMY